MVFAALPALAEIGAGVGTGVGLGTTAAVGTGTTAAAGGIATGAGGLAQGAGMYGAGTLGATGAGSAAGAAGMYTPNLTMGQSMAPTLSTAGMPSTMEVAQGAISPGGMSGAGSTETTGLSENAKKMLKSGGKASTGLMAGMQKKLPFPGLGGGQYMPFSPFSFDMSNYQFRRPIGF